MPPLFELQASFNLHWKALKCSRKNTYLPKLTQMIKSEELLKNGFVVTYAEGIKDVCLDMALYCTSPISNQQLVPQLDRDTLAAMNLDLRDFARDAVADLCTVDFIQEGRIPEDFILQLLRAIAFMKTLDATLTTHADAFYTSLVFAMSYLTCYQYFSNILEPIVYGLPKFLGKDSAKARTIVDLLKQVSSSWIMVF